MSRRTTPLIKAALTGLHYLGVGRRVRASGAHAVSGIIYMLHHVVPDMPNGFSPNRILKVTPEFLEVAIAETRASGFETVSLDEAHRRMTSGQTEAPFACFTFDDGYRDNATYAYPILKQHNVPFAIYVTPKFADGEGDFWWLALEEIIARAIEVKVSLPMGERVFATRTDAEKNACFHDVYWSLRRMPERAARDVVRGLADQVSYDPTALSRGLPMNWEELRALNADPLVTLAAHTTNHFALAKLDQDEACAEICDSIARLEAELGVPCRHFSYPYGDAMSAGPREFALARDLNMLTAVTTRKGLVMRGGGGRDLHALKRLSLNGDYQERKYLRVLMSGLPFRLMDQVSGARELVRFRRQHLVWASHATVPASAINSVPSQDRASASTR